MMSSHGWLWHYFGRVSAWVTLLFAVGNDIRSVPRNSLTRNIGRRDSFVSNGPTDSAPPHYGLYVLIQTGNRLGSGLPIPDGSLNKGIQTNYVVSVNDRRLLLSFSVVLLD